MTYIRPLRVIGILVLVLISCIYAAYLLHTSGMVKPLFILTPTDFEQMITSFGIIFIIFIFVCGGSR